jgi:hypothetical protein
MDKVAFHEVDLPLTARGYLDGPAKFVDPANRPCEWEGEHVSG